jgi:acetyl esterase/lipase
MELDKVHPELRAPLRKLPDFDFSKRWMRLLGRVAPRLIRTPRIPGVAVRWVSAGAVRLRVYQPTSPAGGGGMLWIHGGGLVIGSPLQDGMLCAQTAAELGITVVAVEYRLAPEHPFPAALDDATRAWEWIQNHGASVGIDPARVVIGGESAGAGIAANLAQRLHDTAETQPIGQWLFAPMLDDRTAAKVELDAVDHPVWTNKSNRYGWEAYLGQAPGSAGVPAYASAARRENLAGLPPVWMYVGDIELFHDENVDYAGRLRAAGVPVEFEVLTGAAHGFEAWAPSTKLARELVGRARTWLAAVVAG